ncbi:hydroxymethylglutaryl-CoA lyase [Cnuella takakiae]|uniref:Hydroxymethylglutaryl-CoA lyase n=1 Tax=Cnuella takakiae TaxID=1302690 RepID=A0A1M4VNL2_9BACT|nr:hydroxymethylglutaryl-CoA lyase [Cnuella takakiae]OLY92540.1 hydroxymethylglutaryl-CoA lyase [Cnuella takakiae]SHE70691.1 hydroxymethylglutaryl-CoA lyase [Cnuella takakiae]
MLQTPNPKLQTSNLVECPRDAMQGWKTFIPTEQKITYLNALLQVGFHTLDFGSFVSPKAIPQMADTREVLAGLDLSSTGTKLLAIVANQRGAEEAVAFEQIHYLGFPFSLSPTFQQRNTNSTIGEAVQRVDAIQELCLQHNKELVLYLSMGFGNPYGDAYNEAVLLHWADAMAKKGIRIISLADTVGVANPEQISFALNTLIPQYREVQFGVHLHSASHNWRPKVQAAFDAGCMRFDGALKGIGGCPMAGNDLVGNMDTEWLLAFFREQGLDTNVNKEALRQSLQIGNQVFGT